MPKPSATTAAPGDGIDDEVVRGADDDQQGGDRVQPGRAARPQVARATKIAMPHHNAQAMCRLGIAANWLECSAMFGSASEPQVWNFDKRVDVAVLRQQPWRGRSG